MQLFCNNGAAILAGGITAAAGSLTLNTGAGAKFPAPAGGNYFLLTLYQMSGANEINHEIVKCIARSGDVLTVLRGQDNTAARAFNAADPVSARLSAAAMTPAAIGAYEASNPLNFLSNETLPAMNKSLHAGAVVKTVLYDTANDSDGGAWRKRCQDKSWYVEALCGAWLGQAAGEALARVALASQYAPYATMPGAYYQNTGDGKFYALNAVSGSTEVFRGNTREFPAQVAIVAERTRVVLYDLTQAGCPMWMVFATGENNWLRIGNGINSVAAFNGVMVAGSSAQDASLTNFVSEIGLLYAAGLNKMAGNIASRNSSQGFNGIAGNTIASRAVTDIAMAVLDGAPVDPATSLPIPTIAVATAGGISIIKSDGAIVNWLTNKGQFARVSIDPLGRLFACGGATVAWATWFKNALPTVSPDNTSDYIFNQSSIPARLGTDGNSGAVGVMCAVKGGAKALGGNSGSGGNSPFQALYLLKDNPASPANGMVAYITNAYASGWQVGDIRGAWLADVVPETILEPAPLVANGTFATDTAGWTSSPNYASTAVAVSGEMQVTSTAAYGYHTTPIACVVGKTYVVTGMQRKISGAGSAVMTVATSTIGGNVAVAPATTSATPVAVSMTFTATQAVLYIVAGDGGGAAGTVSGFDNIACKLIADADRSIKNSGLVINGAIVKTAVASGAALVKYAGFLAGVNYLSQPYTPNLDYGTGDFHYMFWCDASAQGTKFSRGDGLSAGSIVAINKGGGDTMNFFIHDGAIFRGVVAAQLPRQAGLVVIQRTGIAVQVWFNGALVNFGNNPGTVSNAGAQLHIGNRQDSGNGDNGWTALFRTGATALSSDQIAHIYRTELSLFQPGAQCTLDGTSSAVTALAYDDTADILQAGTPWGRSAFKDLLRIESAASLAGAITSLAAGQGGFVSGGATGAAYYQPALLLRDELRRQDAARRAMSKIPTPIWFTGDGITAAFALTKGFDPRFVYKQGLLMRDGAANDYTVAFDGFQWTVTFLSAPLNLHNICIMGTRNG